MVHSSTLQEHGPVLHLPSGSQSHDPQLQCCQSCQKLGNNRHKGRDTGKHNDRHCQGCKNEAHLATVSVTTPPSEIAHVVSSTSSTLSSMLHLPLLLLPMHSGPPMATRVMTASLANYSSYTCISPSFATKSVSSTNLGLRVHTPPHRTSAASAQVCPSSSMQNQCCK